jgi:hypothetical protein
MLALCTFVFPTSRSPSWSKSVYAANPISVFLFSVAALLYTLAIIELFQWLLLHRWIPQPSGRVLMVIQVAVLAAWSLHHTVILYPMKRPPLLDKVTNEMALQMASSLDSVGRGILAQFQATPAELEHRLDTHNSMLQNQIDLLVSDTSRNAKDQTELRQ